VSTFITRLPHAKNGIRLAVKDLIDVAGVPTTAGCRAVAERAGPAERDAPCMAGARAAGAAIVGKVNLYELAYGASGTNQWYGTPVNPLDPALVPGGSSSGSAVAVADGEADIAYGSDTGGSVRIPSACCGITGLKTTHGRVSLEGVWPLAPSLDTVGPMARDVAGVRAGMLLLEPGFSDDVPPAVRVGRLRPPWPQVDPRIDAAVDQALARSGLEVLDAPLDGWRDALRAGGAILDYEAAQCNSSLRCDERARGLMSAEVLGRLDEAAKVTPEQARHGREFQARWREVVAALLGRVQLLALPVTAFFPPSLTNSGPHPYTGLTLPSNLTGFPALALPVPSSHTLPASLQLIGPPGGEELLLATGAIIEATAGYQRR
jgi:amidase